MGCSSSKSTAKPTAGPTSLVLEVAQPKNEEHNVSEGENLVLTQHGTSPENFEFNKVESTTDQPTLIFLNSGETSCMVGGEDTNKDSNNSKSGDIPLQTENKDESIESSNADCNILSLELEQCSTPEVENVVETTQTAGKTNDSRSPYSELVDMQPLREIAPGVSDQNLYKFYCYRQNTEERIKIFLDHKTWRSQNEWVDNPPLRADSDSTLKRILLSETIVQPKGMVDKQGRPCLFLRLRNNDMTDGRTPKDVCRCALYNIERLLQRKEAVENGVCLVNDLSGMTKKNFHSGIPKVLMTALSGEKIPIRVKQFILINPPWFFNAVFSIVQTFMSPKLRRRFVILKSFDEVNEYIDSANLLEENGGLVKHNQMEWLEEQLTQEQAGQLDLLEFIVKNCAKTN